MMKKNTTIVFCFGVLVLCLFFKTEVKAQKYALVFDVTQLSNGCRPCLNSIGCIQRVDPRGISPVLYFYPPNDGSSTGTHEVYNIRVNEDPRNYNWVYAQAEWTFCLPSGSPSCNFPYYSNIPIYSGPLSCGTTTYEDLNRPGINIKTKYSGPINAPLRVDLKALTDMCDDVVAIQTNGFASGTFSWQVTRNILDSTSWVEFAQSTGADAMAFITTNVSKAILSNVIGPINYGDVLNIRVSAPICWSPSSYRRSPPTSVSFRSPEPASYSTLKTSPTCVGGTDGKIEVYDLKNADGSAFTSTDSLVYSLKYGPNTYNIKSKTRDVVFDQTAAGGFASIHAGPYTVVIENPSRTCSTPPSNLPINIVDPPALAFSPMTTSQAITCSGGKGVINAIITNGKSPYTFHIDGGVGVQSSSSSMAFADLLSGNHDVSVTDFCGQSVDTTIYLGEPAAVVPSLTVEKNVSCAGQSDGKLKAVASGGTPSYAVQVDGGSFINILTNTYTFNSLTAGNHHVTIRDANGCTASGDTVINTNAAIKGKIQANDLKPVTCAGANNGLVFLTASGSAGVTFEYSLNSSAYQPINGFADLYAGTFPISIRDANAIACHWDSSVVITEPMRIHVDEFVVASAISCYGESDGVVRTSASGGMPQFGYTYSLLEVTSGYNDSHTSSSPVLFNNLAVGNYHLTVGDGVANCFVTQDLLVSEPTAVFFNPTLSNYNGQHVSCTGSSDGSITIRSTGGTYPHRVSVSGRADQLINSNAETAVFNNFQAGDYFFTITSNNGACQKDTLIRLIAPPPIDINLSARAYGDGYQVSCKGASNGMVAVKGSGGTHPYTYSIIPNGTPLTYSNVNLDSVSFANLIAGSYSVNIKDINNCSTVDQILITEPAELKVSSIEKPDIFGRQLTCHGDQNAVVTVYTTGGSYPQTITLQSTTQQGTSNSNSDGILFTNLGAGSYNLSIIDEEGCTASGNFDLIEPDVVALSIREKVKPDCADQPTGSLHLQAVGGIGTSYQYQLTYPGDRSHLFFPYPEQQSQTGNPVDFNLLIAGDYSLQVSDEVGCSYNELLTIETNLQVTTAVRTSNITCKRDTDGSASIIISGGIAPYTLLWKYQDQTIQTNNNIAELAASVLNNRKEGLYTFDISDANGCGFVTGTYKFEINGPAEALVLRASTTQVTCHADNNGMIVLAATGGWQQSAYRYGTDINHLTINQTIYEELSPGAYTYYAIDNRGCVDTLNVNITEPDILSVNSFETKNVSCHGLADGSFVLNIQGGSIPYQVSIDNGLTWKKGNGLELLKASTYTTLIQDSNACATSQVAVITEPEVLKATLVDQTNTLCKQSTGSAVVQVTGGTPAYHYSWANNQHVEIGTSLTATNLLAGLYLFKVVDDHACENILPVTIINTNDIIFDVSNITPVKCYGDANGSAVLNITTIQSPYTILWNNGAVTLSTATLLAGENTVILEDANQCQVTKTFVVPGPEALALNATQSLSPTCYGTCNGSLSVQATGGNGGYAYSWIGHASIANTLSNVCAGNYMVTVKDAKNCLVSRDINLSGPSAHKLGIEDTTYYICQGQKVNINLMNWNSVNWSSSNGFISSSNVVVLTQAGDYQVSATDALGCQASTDFKVIYSSDVLKSEFLVPRQTYVGDTIVCVNISVPEPDSWTWAFDENKIVSLRHEGAYQQLVFLQEGEYQITLVSHLGSCVAEQSKTVLVVKNKPRDEENDQLGYEEKGIKEVIVFPNPNDGQFTCEVILYKEEEMELKVMDLYGHVLTSYQGSKAKQFQADLSIGLQPAGLYWLVIKVGDDMKIVKVLVK